jgi:uncharacterized protein YceK
VERHHKSAGVEIVKVFTLLLLLLTGCSSMSKKEIVWQSLHAVDVAQTLQIAKNADCFAERNPMTVQVIGEHPSEKNVLAWGVLLSIGYHYLDEWLTKNTPNSTANTFRFLFISDKSVAVMNNFNDGLYLTHSSGCSDGL